MAKYRDPADEPDDIFDDRRPDDLPWDDAPTDEFAADVDQQIRINELRETARELTGGQMSEFEEEDAPPELIEQFWANVVEFERAPWTSEFELLSRDGVELPDPLEADDATVTERLWAAVHAMARRRTYLSNTDHLSDRELYTLLWEEIWHERTKDVPHVTGDPDDKPRGCCHIDIVSSGSEEDLQLFLRYYADEQEREMWAKDFPLPPREKPPYDRDRHLPQPPEPEGGWEEEEDEEKGT
jgi:hypothetical protein